MILLSIFIAFSFLFVIFRGAPFVSSREEIIQDAYMLLNLSKDDTLVDLGCGSGRVLKFFSDKGIQVVGYELNPILYLFCKLRFINNSNVKVLWGDYQYANLETFDAIYVFTAGPYIKNLVRKLKKYPEKKVISVGFKLPDLKKVGSSQRVFLYLTS